MNAVSTWKKVIPEMNALLPRIMQRAHGLKRIDVTGKAGRLSNDALQSISNVLQQTTTWYPPPESDINTASDIYMNDFFEPFAPWFPLFRARAFGAMRTISGGSRIFYQVFVTMIVEWSFLFVTTNIFRLVG